MPFNQYPKIHHSIQRAISAPPMLEVFMVRNENAAKAGEGGRKRNEEGKGGGGKGGSDTKIFFFPKEINALGCLPRSACLRSLA